MSRTINRQEFAARAAELPREVVEIPEWDGNVIIRGMTAKEKIDFERSLDLTALEKVTPEKVSETLAPRLLSLCMTDGEGNRLLDDEDGGAIVASLRADVFQRLVQAAFRVNGYAESAEGNSKPTLNGDSFSD